MHTPALLRFCQLVSPALPIGGFNFSQGLEYAVEMGWVTDEASARQWIAGLARHAVGTLDLPLLYRVHAAWQAGDVDAATKWNALLLASRETAELRAEDRHLGAALKKILLELHIAEAQSLPAQFDCGFAAMFALAAVAWNIESSDAAAGYLWIWVENQVLAAVKLVPLGQTAGQRLLNELIADMPAILERAALMEEGDIGISTPMQGIASAGHESQYSRLFRS